MICALYKDLIIPEKDMNANWEKALVWLKGESWKNLPDGKVEIDGTKAYATFSSYTTKLPSEGRYESHRLYADIQIILKGNELVLVCDRKALTVTVPYSPEKDIDFLDGNSAPVHHVLLSNPAAVVFFPEDAHKPNLAVAGKPAEVWKLVVKVALK
jgi:YhcH/YjgK/YiaL family protein